MEEFLKNFALVPRDVLAIPIMAIIFAIFWRIFGATVMTRHLALFEQRERSTSGASKGAEENLSAALKLTAEYEQKMAQERAAILKSLEPKLQAARSEAGRIVESAEAEAATLIESTRASIMEDQNRLESVIEGDADSLANTISERVLA